MLSIGKDESLEEKCRNVAGEGDVYVYSNANKNECVTFAGMTRQGEGDYVDIRAHGGQSRDGHVTSEKWKIGNSLKFRMKFWGWRIQGRKGRWALGFSAGLAGARCQ